MDEKKLRIGVCRNMKKMVCFGFRSFLFSWLLWGCGDFWICFKILDVYFGHVLTGWAFSSTRNNSELSTESSIQVSDSWWHLSTSTQESLEGGYSRILWCTEFEGQHQWFSLSKRRCGCVCLLDCRMSNRCRDEVWNRGGVWFSEVLFWQTLDCPEGGMMELTSSPSNMQF